MSALPQYLIAFSAALALHGGAILLLKVGLGGPPEYAVVAGDSSVEVSLVAAPPAPEESPAEIAPSPPPESEPIPQPSPVPEPEPTPGPEPTPPPVLEEPKPLPIPATTPKPRSKPMPAPPRRAPSRIVGDGSSARPGRDATSARAGAAGQSAKPGYLHNPHPSYPVEARRARVEGTVMLRVRVDTAGRVASVSVVKSSGHRALDERALSTVRDRWRFKPARAAGLPVGSEVIIPIRFDLR